MGAGDGVVVIVCRCHRISSLSSSSSSPSYIIVVVIIGSSSSSMKKHWAGRAPSHFRRGKRDLYDRPCRSLKLVYSFSLQMMKIFIACG